MLREWRRETDKFIMSLNFRMKMQGFMLQRMQIKSLGTIRVINEKNLLRHKQLTFNKWKVQALVEKQVLNKKVQKYFLNNAMTEVERSKQTLV